MSIVTLEDVKSHARITIEEDDNLIQSKIDAAEAWLGLFLGADLSTFSTLPPGEAIGRADGYASVSGASTNVNEGSDDPPSGSTTTLPAPLQEAVRQLVAWLYDNRESAIVGSGITILETTPGMYDMLNPYRTFVF